MFWTSVYFTFWKKVLQPWKRPAHKAQMMLVCKGTAKQAGRGADTMAFGCPSISKDPGTWQYSPITASAVALLVCLPTSTSRCSQRLYKKQQIGILLDDSQTNTQIMLNNMPEVGADSCCEDAPGWGSFVRPITDADSDRSLLMTSLHLEELWNPTDLNLGSRSVARVNTLNDSRFEAVWLCGKYCTPNIDVYNCKLSLM